MLKGCLPQVNICRGCAKPKLPKVVHKLLKGKKQATDRKKKKKKPRYYPELVILKPNFYIFIARKQESVVAKVLRTILRVLKKQFNSLCIYNAIGAQAARAWKVSGCARRNPVTQHSAFWRALNGSKARRISCEGKQDCNAFDHRVHSWLSSWACVLPVPHTICNCTRWVGCVQ